MGQNQPENQPEALPTQRIDLAGYWRVAGWWAVIIGTFIRFIDISRFPLWCDELASLQRTELALGEHLAELSARAPLFEMLLRFWVEPGMTDAQLRIPWALFGSIALWVVWRATREVAGDFVGAIAAGLIALSPLHLMFSRITREYSLAVMLAAISTYALWKVYSDPRRRWLVLYAISTIAALYTTYIMCGVVLAHNIFIFWILRGEKTRLLGWLKTQGIIALVFAPWFIISIVGALRFAVGAPYAPHQAGLLAKAAYLAFAMFAGETISPLNLPAVAAAGLGFGAAGVSGLARLLKRDRRQAWFILPVVVIIYGVGLSFAAASPKHLAVMLPALIMLIALGIAYMRPRWLRAASLLLVFGVSAYSVFNYFSGEQFADASMVTPWREMAEFIEHREHGDELIYVGWRTKHDRFGTDKDIFARYYEGDCELRFLSPDDWAWQIDETVYRDGRVWLQTHRDEPWEEIKAASLEAGRKVEVFPFQKEEEILRRLREGGPREEFITYMYRLILIESSTD